MLCEYFKPSPLAAFSLNTNNTNIIILNNKNKEYRQYVVCLNTGYRDYSKVTFCM